MTENLSMTGFLHFPRSEVHQLQQEQLWTRPHPLPSVFTQTAL